MVLQYLDPTGIKVLVHVHVVDLNNEILSSSASPHLEPDPVRQVDLLCVPSPGIEEGIGGAGARWLVRVQLSTCRVVATGPYSLETQKLYI